MDVAREQSSDHLAGVDADAQRHLRAVAPLQVVVELRDRQLHREGRADGALGIVLVRHRRPEDRHDGVADVLVDRPAVALDLARQRAKERGQDSTQVFGVEPFPERGRARQVGEQDGDQTPVLAQVDARVAGDLERRSAAGCRLLGRCAVGRGRRRGRRLRWRAAVRTEAMRRTQHGAARRATRARPCG